MYARSQHPMVVVVTMNLSIDNLVINGVQCAMRVCVNAGDANFTDTTIVR